MKILKEVKNSPFKPLVKKYYLGKITHGCPYFYPTYFHKNIISIRRLWQRSEEEVNRRNERYPYLKTSNDTKFSNLPMVKRSKSWIINILNCFYYIEIGWPLRFHTNNLGWKDKYDSPRFEWPPAFYIYFFRWQFCIWWVAPTKYQDNYWEMFLWWKNYSDKDLIKAEKTWGWTDYKTKLSTWDKNNLK